MQGVGAIELTPQLFPRLKPAKIIKQHTKDIVGIDFSNDGQLLYIADNQTLSAILTTTGQSYRKLYLKNHQIQQISHTHHNSAILVATKKNHMVLYWSIHQNRIIKLFKGHNDSIVNLMINYKDDVFLTTSNDNTLRLWNLNSDHQDCDFKLNVEAANMAASPVASFDPTGLTFAVSWSQQQNDKQVVRICMYAIEECEGGPFTDWYKDYNQIKMIKFSPSGHSMLLATSDNLIVMIDALEGNQQMRFSSFLNESSIIECCFSPDSRFVASGSENGLVHVWSKDGKEVAKLSSHVEKVSCLKFSPTRCMLASAGRNVTVWLPDTK